MSSAQFHKPSGEAIRLESGCQIDGSHMSADDFNITLIAYARDLGYKFQDTTDKAIFTIASTPHLKALLPEISPEGTAEATLSERLIAECDRAEAFLNEHIQDGWVFHIHEQDLFLTSEQDLEMWHG